MSAFNKVDDSRLTHDEKEALKTLLLSRPSVRARIVGNAAVTDTLLREYLWAIITGTSVVWDFAC
jgi:hypothetical protein